MLNFQIRHKPLQTPRIESLGIRWAVFGGLLSLFVASGSLAQNVSTIRNPRTFNLNFAGLSYKALGFSCLTMTDVADDLLCQPAFLPLEKKSRFSANGYISNGYDSLAKGRRILANDLDSDFIASLFRENRVIEVELSPSMLFSSQVFAGKYMLYGFQYYSTQRNQADPILNVFAADSKAWQFQWGKEYGNWFYYGVQLRTSEDTVIKKAFRLVDTGTDAGKNLLKPRKGRRVYLEPGIGFIGHSGSSASEKGSDSAMGMQGSQWKISLFGANLMVNEYIEDNAENFYEDKPELQVGASYSTEMFYGLWDLMLDYKSLESDENADHKFHLGSRYRYGVLNVLGGLDYYGASLGILFYLEKIYSGIMYSTSQVPWRSHDDFVQTVYIQLGWQL